MKKVAKEQVRVKRKIKELLVVLNSTRDFKYPIGNKALWDTVRDLENSKQIVYDDLFKKWAEF